VSPAGEVKLLDFGVAKLIEPQAFGLSTSLTGDRGTPLTPAYAAPEQLLGGAITTATDVYSLGVLTYELLTGCTPVALSATSAAELERALAGARIVPPSERMGGRRLRDLDAVVLTALRSAPERRYLSAGQLGEDIGRYLAGHPVIARADTLAYRARRFVARHRLAVAAAALFVLGLAGFGGVAAWQARTAARERDAARAQGERAEQLVGALVELFEGSNPTVRPGGDSVSVREFLARAEPRVLERLAGQPITRARLLQLFGRIYAAQDRYPEARRALEQALAEQRRLLGPDHPDAVDTLDELGAVLHTIGDAGARSLLEESLDRNRRVHGEEHVRTARALAALGSDSISHLRQALAIQERLLPARHPDRVASEAALAAYLFQQGDMQGARARYASTLAAFPTPELRRHPVLLALMSGYATLLRSLGELAAAEALHREIDATARVVLGPQSRVVAHNLNNLGVLLAGQSRFVDAEKAFRDSHAAHVALLGAAHPETTSIARSIGTVIGLQENWSEALPWVERSLAGVDPVRDLRAWHSRRTNLARVLHRLGRSEEALHIVTEAVDQLGPRVAEDGPDRLREALFWQALVLIELGRTQPGEAAARAAIRLFEQEGEPGIRRAGAECLVGWAMLLTGREAEGHRILARALPVYAAWGRADRVMVAKLQAVMAQGPITAR
jgi:eukaryotic-like serine/threonine-protein kinase